MMYCRKMANLCRHLAISSLSTLVALSKIIDAMQTRHLLFTLFMIINPVLIYAQTKPENISSNFKNQHMQTKESKIVNEFLTAVQTGDMKTVAALLHPDVKWQQPGSGDISGIKHSAQEVFEMVTGMFEISANTLKLKEIKWVSANGSTVAGLLRWTATKPSGESLDVENIDVYTLEDGKIVAVTVYSSDINAENSFWKK
jgi:uncharacterized protein